jgi:uncharacterized surface protein with fasciclin (FAS1) repeats
MNRFKRIVPVLVAVVLLAGSAAPALAGPPPWAGPPPEENIVEKVIALNSSGAYAGEFDTLIEAVLVADPAVLATLSGKGQFVVFGPTDAAFDKLGLNSGNIGGLPQDALTEILLYHVGRGRLNSNAVLGSKQIRTLQGGFVYVKGTKLVFDGGTAGFVATDVTASNGIIHAIDTVLIPPAP